MNTSAEPLKGPMIIDILSPQLHATAGPSNDLGWQNPHDHLPLTVEAHNTGQLGFSTQMDFQNFNPLHELECPPGFAQISTDPKKLHFIDLSHLHDQAVQHEEYSYKRQEISQGVAAKDAMKQDRENVNEMVETSDVKVLGAWSSPFAWRPRIALNLKNVDYEYLEQNYLVVKSELLLKSNPIHKKVPVMIHNDKPICESLVIVQYIDEVFTSGASILPSDAYDRAIARFWGAYIDDKWFSSLLATLKAKTEEEKKTAIEGVSTGIELLEEAFEKISKGKDFFGGDTVGYIDIALGANLPWVRVVEKLNGVELLDETKAPNLYAWSEKFCSHPAVKDLIPETDKLLEFAKTLIAKWSAAPQ
ncbi:hypothetical protein IFM89_005451 [Coptis chinensis]|uniref:glutathione transferase n=1 Tax=Coptis chinensis TaxID=261450 RepID=A0A835ITJ6_9MAGN|nr:hypothetical protein IFM89_005451 [Coptis chinensis]